MGRAADRHSGCPRAVRPGRLYPARPVYFINRKEQKMLILKYMTDSPGPTTVLFWIDRQDEKFIHFKASNGWSIESVNYPEVRDSYGYTLYVRGDDESRNHDVVSCCWSRFQQIMEAVREYNCQTKTSESQSGFVPPIQTAD